jgi:hypothetical protein
MNDFWSYPSNNGPAAFRSSVLPFNQSQSFVSDAHPLKYAPFSSKDAKTPAKLHGNTAHLHTYHPIKGNLILILNQF